MRIEFSAGGFSEVDAVVIEPDGTDLVLRARSGGVVARLPLDRVSSIDTLMESGVSALEAAPSASYSVERIRDVHPKAYMPWTSDDEAVLLEMHQAGATIAEMSTALGRQPGGITSRLAALTEIGSKREQPVVGFE